MIQTDELEKYSTASDKVMSYRNALLSRQPKKPAQIPRAMEAFRALTEREKKANAGEFYSKREIKDYLDSKWASEAYNHTEFHRLVEYWLETKDREIARRILVFKKAIDDTSNRYPALDMDTTRYLVKIGFMQPEANYNIVVDELNEGV